MISWGRSRVEGRSALAGLTAGAHQKQHDWSPVAKEQRRFAHRVTIPLGLYIAFWAIFPLLWAVVLAFFDYSARRTSGGPLGLGGENPFVGLGNFTQMLDFSAEAPLQVKLFHNGLKLALIFAFLVVPLNLLITLPLASLIESVHRRMRPVFRTIFFLPVVTSAVAVAVMWGFVFHPQNGLINGLLSAITGRTVVISWLADPDLTLIGLPVAMLAVIVAYLWQDIGYNLIIFIAALQAIPDSLIEAARIDGAGPVQVFTRIVVPLLRPTILLASILTMISAFQVFDLFQVMTGGGPDNQTRVITLDIYESAFRYQRMGWAAAVSIVMLLVVLTIAYFQGRMLRTEWEYV